MLIGDKQLSRLWASLLRPTQGKRPRPELKPQFTRAELRAWLEGQVVGSRGNTPAWRCEYQAPGCSGGKFAIGISEVSLDHRTPISRHAGGLTTLDNLAVCCRRCNALKRDVDERHFRALIEFMRQWPQNYAKSVWGRLNQTPGKWVAVQRARDKESAAKDEDW